MKQRKLSSPVSFHLKKPSMFIFVLLFSILLSNLKVMSQNKNQMIRLAKITVDPSLLNPYTAALKEQMNDAIRLEPGVLTYYAVADKSDPAKITILEIYADTAAYNFHITTPHFKKYKDKVEKMVKALELVDVSLIASARKPDME